MIPLRDTIPSRLFPLVNTILIGLNVLVFLWQLSLGPRVQLAVLELGMIPAAFVHRFSPHEAMTLVTSMFLHAGWFHLLSNMLALYIFGDNVEDRMGSAKYLVFYILCGTLAGFVHIAFNTNSIIPTIGASGAIAGVLGAYLIMYPHARVLTLIPIFYLPWFVEIPALLFLGIWFLAQVFSGTLAIVAQSQQTGGVAFWAHAGGFVAGAMLVFLFARPRAKQRRTAVEQYFPW